MGTKVLLQAAVVSVAALGAISHSSAARPSAARIQLTQATTPAETP